MKHIIYIKVLDSYAKDFVQSVTVEARSQPRKGENVSFRCPVSKRPFWGEVIYVEHQWCAQTGGVDSIRITVREH
jgi:hypothetical protein